MVQYNPLWKRARAMRDLDRSLREQGFDINHSLLEREEEDFLLSLAQIGDEEALDSLVRHNVRLVLGLVNQFLVRAKRVSGEDLFSLGIEGFLHAVQKFDRGSGNRLSTYATWWIRQRLGRGLETTDWGVVRPPPKAIKVLRNLARYLAGCEERGDTPSISRMAADLGESVPSVEKTLTLMGGYSSLNERLEEGGESLEERWGEEPLDLLDEIEGSALIERLYLALETLPELHRKIISLRSGIGVEKVLFQREIGEMFGLSRQRVASLEQQSMEMLGEVMGKNHHDPSPQFAH